jgi:hypothetical protein
VIVAGLPLESLGGGDASLSFINLHTISGLFGLSGPGDVDRLEPFDQLWDHIQDQAFVFLRETGWCEGRRLCA